MVFVGTYAHTIDTKNRLAIPAPIRAQVQKEAGAGEGDVVYLYVTLGEGRSLSLYTEKGFEQRAAELDRSELDAEQLLAYERLFFSLAQRVEMDKQGRVRLPDTLLQHTRLSNEVMLLGVKDHLEVRDRAEWQAYLDGVIGDGGMAWMNPRRAMKNPTAAGAPAA